MIKGLFPESVYSQDNYNLGVFGLNDGLASFYLYHLFVKSDNAILVVANNLFNAGKLYETLLSYTKDVLFFPMDEFIASEALAISPELKYERINTLSELLVNNKKIVVTTLNGYLRFLPSLEVFKKNIITIKKKKEINYELLQENLFSLGYRRQSLVTGLGEYAVRGSILDIFPINFENPIRIEFWGNTVESIREFDLESQLSIKKVDSAIITPNTETIIEKSKEEVFLKLLDLAKEKPYLQEKLSKIKEENEIDKLHKYLPILTSDISNITSYLKKPIVLFLNYTQIQSTYMMLQEEIFNYQKELVSRGEELENLKYMFKLEDLVNKRELYFSTIDTDLPYIKFDKKKEINTQSIDNFLGNLKALNKYITQELKAGYTIVIAVSNDKKRKRLLEYLRVDYVLINLLSEIKKGKLNIINKDYQLGFKSFDEKLILITESDLDEPSIRKVRPQTKFKNTERISSYQKLQVGDYVVHDIHGIGIYQGVVTLTKSGLKKDFLQVEYQKGDKLYIPVEKINYLSKYVGREGVVPKINKLGGSDWQKIKHRVRTKVKDLAEKLLKLYAEREKQVGFAFSIDTKEQIEFEKEFVHEETLDQLKTTEEIKKDMESPVPMDRLLCGDVGFGKTEVAFRAALKAIMDNKQVAFLCPTTILSNQHYKTALDRFRNFGVNIELLNRFTRKSEAKRILEGLKEGKVDFLIGTHRILSKDVKFKDLGLLIIDEEQRFGVIHKEKIKEMKKNIDVLTLTATPIPRTLQMSISGLRSLSLIETPPVNRYPIQTYVIEENISIVRDAIEKELARNGQVFVLYNRVSDIERKAKEIKELVPAAKVTFAHGQMSKLELENRMLAFLNHEYNVLVCTTIIETGIDISSVNTLIVFDADKFGLSQLYQIRGRVGRSNVIAYAYLFYNKQKVLTEAAIKRLQVIKEFTELGSGFKIAVRDLSIRGAGDILGKEQAGFIDTIGIEMYTKMLNEEIKKIKGEVKNEEEVIDEKPLIEVETHIADSYVSDEDIKIEIHNLISNIDSFTSFENIKKELTDRFGKLPENLFIYMYEELFEKIAKKLNVVKVGKTRSFVDIELSPESSSKIDGKLLFKTANELTKKIRFKYEKKKLHIIIDKVGLAHHWLYYAVNLLSKFVE
ncbi:MAG TPA: transcription-repair coupling factor [Tenericutes bacterium]|nr:transcription-repair coupling factor [Mycoplasmatota bacterium]